MIAPLPFDQVKDGLLEAQRELNPRLQQPIGHPKALLLLSRPVASVVLCDEEVTVLEFSATTGIGSRRSTDRLL